MTKFGAVTHMGRGVFYEVSHAIAHCTNASGGLSAIAEFPVVVMGMSFELLAGSLLSLKSEGSAITVKAHDFFTARRYMRKRGL